MADEIRAEKLCVALEGREILRDFSADFPRGVTCVAGPSGRGKTTLLRALAGLIVPQGGRILGTQGLRVAVDFQEDRLLPWATALDNVALVCDRAEAARRLAQVGLADDARKRPSELSGGMRRRTALARALAYGGDLLLLDEPMTGVDASTADAVMAKVREEYAGRFVVLVTHDLDFARRWGDRVVDLGSAPSPAPSPTSPGSEEK